MSKVIRSFYVLSSSGTKLACVSGHARRIFVGEFRPDSDTKFVTCGVKHVCFWSVAGCQLVAKRGVLTNIFEEGDSGTTVKMQTMLSVAFAAVCNALFLLFFEQFL